MVTRPHAESIRINIQQWKEISDAAMVMAPSYNWVTTQ